MLAVLFSRESFRPWGSVCEGSNPTTVVAAAALAALVLFVLSCRKLAPDGGEEALGGN